MPLVLETVRLQLVSYSARHLLALVDSYEKFQATFGLPAAEGLRAFIVSEEVSPVWLTELDESSEANPWVHGFAVVDRESGSVIGNVGFKGSPDEHGVAEIGYGIVPGFEGCGFATEAAAALVTFAFAERNVRCVRAHTLPTRNASTRVLEKCGFGFQGEVEDPEDGPVWRWELRKT
jgi:RimJ/RimL family protein N-acetyltransferase